MGKKTLYSILTVLCIVAVASEARAQRELPSYRIPTSVLSAGGAPMSSSSFRMNATLGQPSPLMPRAQIPTSTTIGN